MAQDVAPRSSIFASQSVVDLTFLWQVTPAFLLSIFVSDPQSSKVGHRQGVLCPNLAAPTFGHVCFPEATTRRSFCGACQHTDGRNNHALPPKITCDAPSGFVAWPPHGAVPTELLPAADWFVWSFATFEPRPGAFDTFSVTVDNQPVLAWRMAALPCTGAGMSDAAGRGLVWVGFSPPLYTSNTTTMNVVVRATGAGANNARWAYSVTPVSCIGNLRPATVPAASACSSPTAADHAHDSAPNATAVASAVTTADAAANAGVDARRVRDVRGSKRLWRARQHRVVRVLLPQVHGRRPHLPRRPLLHAVARPLHQRRQQQHALVRLCRSVHAVHDGRPDA